MTQESTQKFSDPQITATGEKRAWVDLKGLKTLWLNTGTLCNLACINCYIESTPRNDRLVYLTRAEVVEYLDEISKEEYPTEEIGITGGEPFMNPEIIQIIETCLERGFKLLVLTNAMRPMMKLEHDLIRLKETYGEALVLRVSVDHYEKDLHEEERGKNTWAPMMQGLAWLSQNKFSIDIAGRTRWGGSETELRDGFSVLFKQHCININAHDPNQLILFPEMDGNAPVPEITTACWDILGASPDEMMCSSSRMIVKRKGESKPAVVACTLLPYEEQFELGHTLKEASKRVQLNHPHCAKFCVLGGGSCTAK